jgi:hypothetical protein
MRPAASQDTTVVVAMSCSAVKFSVLVPGVVPSELL